MNDEELAEKLGVTVEEAEAMSHHERLAAEPLPEEFTERDVDT